MSKKIKNKILVNGKVFMPEKLNEEWLKEPARDESLKEIYNDDYFISLIPEGCKYFAIDEKNEKIYGLGFNYKEKMEKQISDLEAKLAELESDSNATLNEYRAIKHENKQLQQQLAESKKQCQQCKHLNKKIELNIKNKLMSELAEKEEKLNSDWYKICPRCNNPYGASQFPSKDENGKEIYVCSNCNEKELFYEPLIKQLEEQNDKLIKQRDDANLKLAEKNKETARLKLLVDSFDQLKQYDKDADLILINPKTCYTDGKELVVKADNQDKISFAVEQLEKVKELALKDFNLDKCNLLLARVLDNIDNQIKVLRNNKDGIH